MTGFADVIIRQAQPEDAGAIARVYIETWQSTYAGMLPARVLTGLSRDQQESQWARLLSGYRGREFVVVAEHPTSGPVGFGSAGPLRAPLPFRGEVYTLYLLPDFHGLGVGRHLLAGLFRGLLDRDMSSAAIWVLANNPSRFFYEAVGGKRAGERIERLWGADLPEVAYAWSDLTKATAPGGPCAAA